MRLALLQVVSLGVLRGGDALHSLLRQMHCLYAPAVLGSTSWPEAVKADFTAQLHRFMATLTETVFEVKGKTILYIPAEQIEVRGGFHTVYEVKGKPILYIPAEQTGVHGGFEQAISGRDHVDA